MNRLRGGPGETGERRKAIPTAKPIHKLTQEHAPANAPATILNKVNWLK